MPTFALMTLDACLAQLKFLATSQDAVALARAGEVVDAFAAASPDTVPGRVHALGDLQGRFGREAERSKMRADILDLIGDRVALLLEAGEAEER